MICFGLSKQLVFGNHQAQAFLVFRVPSDELVDSYSSYLDDQ
jgi:hypothetical protein